MPNSIIATSNHLVSTADLSPQEALELANALVAYADSALHPAEPLSASQVARNALTEGRHNVREF